MTNSHRRREQHFPLQDDPGQPPSPTPPANDHSNRMQVGITPHGAIGLRFHNGRDGYTILELLPHQAIRLADALKDMAEALMKEESGA